MIRQHTVCYVYEVVIFVENVCYKHDCSPGRRKKATVQKPQVKADLKNNSHWIWTPPPPPPHGSVSACRLPDDDCFCNLYTLSIGNSPLALLQNSSAKWQHRPFHLQAAPDCPSITNGLLPQTWAYRNTVSIEQTAVDYRAKISQYVMLLNSNCL